MAGDNRNDCSVEAGHDVAQVMVPTPGRSRLATPQCWTATRLTSPEHRENTDQHSAERLEDNSKP